MTYKEVLQKDMQNIKKKTFYRYRAAKILFIVGAFSFFVSFFFVGANFYSHIFNVILPYTYFLFCLSFVGIIYYFFREKFLQNHKFIFSILLGIILGILGVIVLLPLFFSDGIFYFIK